MSDTPQVGSIESPWIKAAGDDNFTEMVLHNSMQGPVLVNFWSRKAGPCIRQYPVLDKVIHQFEGKALLVNLDVDAEKKVVAQLGITSVPTLKLFRNGGVVESCHGYQSEQDLIALLTPNVMRDSDKALTQAVKLYEHGQAQRAYALLTETIIIDPQNVRLPIAYAKLLMHDERFDEASSLLDSMPEKQRNAEVDYLLAQCGFLQLAADIEAPEALLEEIEAISASDENYLQCQKSLCALAAVNQDYETALEALESIVTVKPHYEDQFARKALLNLSLLLKARSDTQSAALLKQARLLLASYAH